MASDLSSIVVSLVGGILVLLLIAFIAITIWQRHSNICRAYLLGIPFIRDCIMQPRDSLTDIGDLEAQQKMSYSQRMAHWRRMRAGEPAVVGVKTKEETPPAGKSASSGYRWKKKWRDRKIKSKLKSKLKHQERKKRRAERARKRAERESESENESDADDEEGDDEGDDEGDENESAQA